MDSPEEKIQSKKFSFKILREKAVDADAFEDNTHERVATSLLSLIESEEKGISIGLEGTWGSGKSTVISILRKKLKEKNCSIPLFQFDAWAHEGDPLRRIFLESLVDFLQEYCEKSIDDKELLKIKKQISNREKITETKTNVSTTILGKLLAFTLLLVPVGTTLFSKVDYEKLLILGQPYWSFIFGILSFIPVTVFAGSLIYHVIKKIKNKEKVYVSKICSFKMETIISGLFAIFGTVLLLQVDFGNLFVSIQSRFLIFGLIAILAPILVLVINLFYRIHKKIKEKKEIWVSSNWSFTQGDSTKTDTSQISEDNERSSIEFEKYFYEVMGLVFDKKTKINKLVLVIDNLDRIDSHDSLKIWSTLQTFLQNRNHADKEKECFSKIWIIVPYDPEGLSALWDTDKKKPISKSFFDKCFQLRMEVPKPIFTGWEKFARDRMKECLEGWKQDDIDEIVRILRITRNGLNDIPTPREIKNYINQVGFLASQFGKEIPIGSIAYYVCWRELGHKSVEEIRSSLIKPELMDTRHLSLMPSSCIKDLAGLTFAVSPEKGEQLLLEPQIANCLKKADHKAFYEIFQNHGEGFWFVLSYHFETFAMDLNYILASADAIYNSIWADYKDRCNIFIQKVIQFNLNSNPDNEWPWHNIRSYPYLIRICSSEESFIMDLYDYLIRGLKNTLQKGDKNLPYVQPELVTVINTIEELNKTLPRRELDELTLEQLIRWAQDAASSKVDSYKYLAPKSSIVDGIAGKIIPSQAIEDGVYEAIEYSINAGLIEGWDKVLIKCHEYIKWNSGTFSNQSDIIFKIINLIGFRIGSAFGILNQIALTGEYYNLLSYRKNENLVNTSLLAGIVFKEKLHPTLLNIQVIGNSQVAIKEIENFWKNKNTGNARIIYDEIIQYKLFSIFWSLVEDGQNKLIEDVIDIALNEKNGSEFFKTEGVLSKLKNYSNLLENKNGKNSKVENIVKAFLNQSLLEQEILEANDLDTVKYCYELYFVAKNIKSNEVLSRLSEKLKSIDQKTWADAFSKNSESSYLYLFAVTIKEKKTTFVLTNAYFEAVVDHITLISKNPAELTELQKENWLVSLMDDNFKRSYQDRVTDHFIKEKFEVSTEFFNINKDYFNKDQIIIKEHKLIQDCFEKYVKEKKYEQLRWLNSILSNSSKKFTPDDHIPSVNKRPFKKLYDEQADDEINKKLIEELADKFEIDLFSKNDDSVHEDEDASSDKKEEA